MRLSNLLVGFVLWEVRAKQLYEVFGPRSEVFHMDPHDPPTEAVGRSGRSDYYASRTQENCTFGLDVIIVQDTTSSLADDLENMRNSEIPTMMSVLSESHPGSRFAVLTHRDKPIWPLGLPGDYCVRTGSPLSSDQNEVLAIYNQTVAYGGADGPECQFVALLAASQLSMYEWDPLHTRLVVVVTDAQPHFNLDGFNSMNLPAASGTYDEADPEGQCISEYYPSPAHVKSSLGDIEAYLAAVVYDPQYQNGLVARSWQWVIRDFGETDDFLNFMSSDSHDFWSTLSRIITELENVECVASTTPIPQTTVPRPDWCPPCTTRLCRRKSKKAAV